MRGRILERVARLEEERPVEDETEFRGRVARALARVELSGQSDAYPIIPDLSHVAEIEEKLKPVRNLHGMVDRVMRRGCEEGRVRYFERRGFA